MLAAALVAGALAASPFAPGGYGVKVTTGSMPSDIKWDYRISSPETAGPYPVVTYVTGFGGSVPSSLYANLTDSMASKGIIVISLSRLAAPAPKTDAGLLAKAVPWLQQNLSPFIQPAVPDWDQFVLAAHSAGNHVNCDFLQSQCGIVKGVVMMDPVDGYDPFGVIKNYCITPGQKVNFTVPALLMRCGLDPTHDIPLSPACAPDDLSNQRFYDAWRGPIWEANATELGHADLLNPGTKAIAGLICPSGAKKASTVDYIWQLAGLTRAFLDLIKGNAAAEGTLTDPSGMLVQTVTNHAYNGHSPPFTGGCTHP